MFWLLLITVQLLSPIDGWCAWQDDWAALQKAAKQEGKLVLIGPTGTDRRDSLVLPFQQDICLTSSLLARWKISCCR